MEIVTSKITPAPDGLERVRQFVNTLDIEEGTDALADSDGARRWLEDSLFVTETVGDEELSYLRTIRRALRDALAANHAGDELSNETLGILNRATEAAQISPELEGRAVRLVPRVAGIEGAVGLLLVEMIEAMRSSTWRRLKICGNDSCQWAFYDRSPARSAKWCSMSICGNRTKQQAFRERHLASSE